MPNNKELKAIVLAGGYGTRLKEFGEHTPKGLIASCGTNLITRVIDGLHDLDIADIVVVTNNKYIRQYRDWVSNLDTDIKLINDGTSTPEGRLGALGDLRFAIEQLGWQKDNIIVAPSDTYFTFSLTSFLSTVHQSPKDFATIVREMDPENIKNRLGCAIVSENNTITDFVEKPENPPSPYAAIPFYYYPANIHALLNQYAAEGNSMDAPGNIIPWLLHNKYPIQACVVHDNTIDVGTIKELEILNSLPNYV